MEQVDQLEGVSLIPLKKFADDRGMVLHMIKKEDPHFSGFGEIYFSVTNPGVTKGWKKHKLMEQRFAVPSGEMEITLIDDRPQSKTKGKFKKVKLGLNNYQLLIIPPNIWYAFKTLGSAPGIIANCASISHDPSESESLPLDKFPVV